AGATVRLKGGVVAIDRTVVADSYGQYESGTIPMGDYTVAADASGYASKQTTADLSSGELIPLGFTLAGGSSTGSSVKGKVTNAVSGVGLPGATVRLGS